MSVFNEVSIVFKDKDYTINLDNVSEKQVEYLTNCKFNGYPMHFVHNNIEYCIESKDVLLIRNEIIDKKAYEDGYKDN